MTSRGGCPTKLKNPSNFLTMMPSVQRPKAFQHKITDKEENDLGMNPLQVTA